ncbi:MAG: MFS transporter [Deltaproteobacteria bacterium]|nr:MFS transporter [Deltaproteobacteria bacterium]
MWSEVFFNKVGGFSREVWISNFAGFSHHLTVGMIHFLPPLYALRLGGSPGIVGLVAAASSLGGLVLALPGGKVIDRLGARKAALYAVTLKIMAILLYLVIASPIGLTLPSFLTSLFGTMTVLSLQSYVSGLSRGVERARGISDFAVFSSVGELAGPLLAGAIADLFGYPMAFLAAASMGTLNLVAVFYFSDTNTTPRVSERRKPLRGFRGLLLDRRVQAVLWASCILSSLRSFHRAFLPALLYEAFSATQIGSLFFVAGIASFLGRSAVRWTVKISPLEKTLPMSLILNAAPTILIAVFSSYAALSGSMFLFGAGNGYVTVVTVVLIAEYVSSGERGLALGMRLTAMRLGAFIGQVAFGTFAEMTSVAAAFVGMGTVGLAVGLLLIFLHHTPSSAAYSEEPDGDSGDIQ